MLSFLAAAADSHYAEAAAAVLPTHGASQALNAVLTPFILLATLVLDRKQTVHDWLLGTVVVRG